MVSTGAAHLLNPRWQATGFGTVLGDFDHDGAPDLAVVNGRVVRKDTTAAVHYLRFRFTPEQVAAFEAGPVELVVDHPEYTYEVTLDATQHAALVPDLTDLT